MHQKTLAGMNILDSTKVLISLSLTTDDQIGQFLFWLKENVAEDKISSMEEKISGKAVENVEEYV